MSPRDFINPHRSILGRGNYNINVIMKALQLKDHEAIWFDKRKFVLNINFNMARSNLFVISVLIQFIDHL